MKPLILAVLIIVSTLSPSGRMTRQIRPQAGPEVIPANLPPVDFTPKEVIDFLSDYSVKHVPGLPGCNCVGLTDPSTRTVYISDEMSLADRRLTVLHEYVHAKLWELGVVSSGPANEVAVEAQAERLYFWIYGPKVDPFELLLQADPANQPADEPQEEPKQ